MKKSLIIGTLLGICSLVHANTVNAPSSMFPLDGNDAYFWGISIAVPSGQQIVSAEIDFTSVTLTIANSSGKGVLYTDLLNSKSKSVGAVSDADAPGDYWLTHSPAGVTAVDTKNFNLGDTKSWNVVLTQPELDALNGYLAGNNGVFDIGLDPDCHFNVTALSFNYTLGPGQHRVPDMTATAFLMLLGLAGLEVFRRQFVAVRVKA